MSKKVKGIIINPDGTHEHMVFKQFKQYPEAIGGWIEAVRLYDYNGETAAMMYVDEEGLLKGLPLNPMAGALSFLFGNTPNLVGRVIVVGKTDNEGYDTDLPKYLEQLIQNISAKEA